MLKIAYKSKTNSFHAYTYIKLQGNSSLSHPKKNFTVNLYANEERNTKLNKESINKCIEKLNLLNEEITDLSLNRVVNKLIKEGMMEDLLTGKVRLNYE